MTAYEKIFLMNTLIGNSRISLDSEEFWPAMRNQAGLVVEETQEAFDETIDENLPNLIKEVADVMVTAIGLFQRLQLCGVDVSEALEIVCDNNLEKFHRTAEHANETLKSHQDAGTECLVRLTTLEDGSEYYAVLRKSDGKMLKPHDFVKVSMQEIADMSQKLSDAAKEEVGE